MSAEPPPPNPADDDAERGDTPRAQLHNNIVEQVRNHFSRTLVIRSSRSRNRKAASRADSGVAPELAIAGPANQPDPPQPPQVLVQEVAAPPDIATPDIAPDFAAPAPRRIPPPTGQLLAPAEYTFAASLEVDADELAAQNYLMSDITDGMSPQYVTRPPRRHRLPHRSNTLLEADPEMMDHEYNPGEFTAGSAAASIRGPPIGTRTDRTRTLLERYGVPYEDMVDIVPGQDGRDGGLRVHARVRMRVRYSCHVCDTTFRHEHRCRQCLHIRCDSCPRMLPHRRAQEL